MTAESSTRTPFLPLSRGLVFGLFLLAVANGVFLYFLPGLAEEWYAWPITPPVNAAAMGAGYLAGTFATGLAAFGVRYWRSVRVLIGPFAVLGLSLFIATLLHADRFRWNYPPTWIWTAVYFILPIGSLVIWIVQERGRRPSPPFDERLAPFRRIAPILGLPLLLASLWLYLQPQAFLEIWPWPITPLLGRVFAGWYIFASLLLIVDGLTARRPHEAPIAYGTVALWNVLLLLLPIIYAADVRPAAGLVVWPAVHLVWLLFTAWAAIATWRMTRASGDRF